MTVAGVLWFGSILVAVAFGVGYVLGYSDAAAEYANDDTDEPWVDATLAQIHALPEASR